MYKRLKRSATILVAMMVEQRGVVWLGRQHALRCGVAQLPTRGLDAIRAILSYMFYDATFYRHNKLRVSCPHVFL